MVDSSSSLLIRAKEAKAHQVATLYLKYDTCQQKKIRFSKIKNKTKKKNAKHSQNTNTYSDTHQTKTSRPAADHWYQLAPSLVLKLF